MLPWGSSGSAVGGAGSSRGRRGAGGGGGRVRGGAAAGGDGFGGELLLFGQDGDEVRVLGEVAAG